MRSAAFRPPTPWQDARSSGSLRMTGRLGSKRQVRRAERTLAALADLASLIQLRADGSATVAARVQAALEDIRAVLEMVDQAEIGTPSCSRSS
jgi:hypothetical protein